MIVCRKDYRDLLDDERDDFVAAIQSLHAEGGWEPYADMHASQFGVAHGGPFFLPWHREFLARIEADLQRVADDPTLAIPYWDWTNDRSPSSSLWDTDFMGAFDGWTHSSTGGEVRRDVLGNTNTLPTAATVEEVLGITSFYDNEDPSGGFAHRTEVDAHNDVHGWVGGIMASAHSPFDPIFLLNHANVDHIWAEWQQRHPEAGYNGRADETNPIIRQGLNDPMPPWNTAGDSVTPAQVLDHNQHPKSAYVYDTTEPTVTPRTTSLAFPAVPEGKTTAHAAVFDVVSCDYVNFKIDLPNVDIGPEDAFDRPFGSSRQVTPAAGEAEGRLWISYTAGSAGEVAEGSVAMHATRRWKEFGTGDTLSETDSWPVSLSATAVPKPKVAVDLVVDKSGSMAGDSGVEELGGGDISRMDLIKSEVGAYPLIQLLDDDDGIGVVWFDSDAQPGTADVRRAGPPFFGQGRSLATTAINSPSPGGSTSIGDGIELAHTRLAGLEEYDTEAIVVLTDGHENTPKSIDEVSALIDEDVYAIGMGTEDVLRPEALRRIANGSDGFLMLTGQLDPDDRFRVAKYYLEILTGVKNHQTVSDPTGYLNRGERTRIPFELTEADSDVDVVVLGPPVGRLFEFALETPDGERIEPQDAGSVPGLAYEAGEGMTFYRFSLPTVLDGAEVRPGTWHAVLGIDEESRMFGRYLNLVEETDPDGYRIVEAHGVRYNLSVHARSSLEMTASLSQNGRTPGSSLGLRASVSQYGIPLGSTVAVVAELTHPDGLTTVHRMDGTDSGAFETSVTASQSGVYRVRVLAEGHTLNGTRFTREQTLTGSVGTGQDRSAPDLSSSVRNEAFCELLLCLTDEVLEEAFERLEIDGDELRRCVKRYCEALRSTAESDGGRRRRRPNIEDVVVDPRVRTALSTLGEVVQSLEDDAS